MIFSNSVKPAKMNKRHHRLLLLYVKFKCPWVVTDLRLGEDATGLTCRGGE